MNLKTYLFDLPTAARSAFAESVGTSAKHLQNVAYGYKPLDPKVCIAIEHATEGKVTRKSLRPDDWALIWPDLAQGVEV